MTQQTPHAYNFKTQLIDSLQRETLNSRAVKIERNDNVYTCGDQDEMVYFIESGQIKLLMLSPEGKECLLAIHGETKIKSIGAILHAGGSDSFCALTMRNG